MPKSLLQPLPDEILSGYEAHLYLADLQLYGLIYLPQSTLGQPLPSTADWLNQGDSPLLPLASVNLYRSDSPATPRAEDILAVLPSMGLPKERVLYLQGGRPPAVRDGKRRRVALLYPHSVLVGWLEGPEGQDFHQYMALALPFQPLFEAEVYPLGQPLSQAKCLERHPFLTVNLRQARGFFAPMPEGPGGVDLTLF